MPDIVAHILLPLMPALLGQPVDAPGAQTSAGEDPAVLAEQLGLGERMTANRLLVAAPDPRWVEAAAGEPAAGEHATGENRARDGIEAALRWPVQGGRFVRGVGYTRTRHEHLPHDGIDIAAEPGTPVLAAAGGIVAYADDEVHGFGNFVGIVHADGTVSLYAHLRRAGVVAGQRVRQGERIGEVGNTGISRGPHLHFEWRRRGHVQDPLPEIARWLRTQAAGARLADAGDIARGAAEAASECPSREGETS